MPPKAQSIEFDSRTNKLKGMNFAAILPTSDGTKAAMMSVFQGKGSWDKIPDFAIITG